MRYSTASSMKRKLRARTLKKKKNQPTTTRYEKKKKIGFARLLLYNTTHSPCVQLEPGLVCIIVVVCLSDHWQISEEGQHNLWVALNYLKCHVGDCGSGVEPASWKVTGSIPLICMLKCPWASYWTTNCSWCAVQHLAWLPPPSVYECMYELVLVVLVSVC